MAVPVGYDKNTLRNQPGVLWIFKSLFSVASEIVCVLQILMELEHSGVGRNKEQAATMLGHLVSTAPRLIKPYMEPILKVCHSDTWQTDWSVRFHDAP